MYRKVCALAERDGKVLLITSTMDPEFFSLPGGPERDEMHGATLARELRAELGVDHIRITESLGPWHVTSNIDGDRVCALVYRTEFDGDPKARQPGRQIMWANLSSPVKLTTTARAVIKDMLSG